MVPGVLEQIEDISREFISRPSEMQTCPQPATAGKGGGSIYLPFPRASWETANPPREHRHSDQNMGLL